MAASTKVARRLGRNDKANECEVLINLVTQQQAKGAVRFKDISVCRAKRLAQKGCGPFGTLNSRPDTPTRPPGKRDCLTRSRSTGTRNGVTPSRPAGSGNQAAKRGYDAAGGGGRKKRRPACNESDT